MRSLLVSQVNAEAGLELVFTVRNDMSVDGVAGWIPIAPTGDGRPTVDLDFKSFMKRTAIVVWPGNDQSKRREIGVRQLYALAGEQRGRRTSDPVP